METNEGEEEGTSIGLAEERERLEKQGHECPMPKPGEIVGEVLRLGNRNERRRRVRLEVVVEREEERSSERREE